jgi:adenylate kinase
MTTFRLRHRLTLMGAPGSGKGYYGKALAQAWKVPLWTASSILRDASDTHDLDGGQLVDCSTVSRTLLHRFANEQQPHTGESGAAFVLDGYPRTLRQIHLMQEHWPSHLQVGHAVLLDVPESACLTKIQGRRFCLRCQRQYNTMGYHEGDFDLPPLLPTTIPCAHDASGCNPQQEWQQRADDADAAIVRARQSTHRANEQPIIDHFEQRGRLLRYTPYRGAKDLDDMRLSIEQWIQEDASRGADCDSQEPPCSP